jgi:hypothetical protein
MPLLLRSLICCCALRRMWRSLRMAPCISCSRSASSPFHAASASHNATVLVFFSQHCVRSIDRANYTRTILGGDKFSFDFRDGEELTAERTSRLIRPPTVNLNFVCVLGANRQRY